MRLLALHPTLIVLHIQIELVYHVLSVILACSSDVPSHRILADLLLEKFLVILVLLCILLQKLSQSRIKLCTVASRVRRVLSLLCCGLGPIEDAWCSCSIVESHIWPISAPCPSRPLLHHVALLKSVAVCLCHVDWCEA